jgi:formylglycine-generating enzyme required for sulfatase activity
MINFSSKILLLIVFCITIVSCITSNKALTTEALEVNAADVPPGTIKVNDSTCMDRVPVTNGMYNEFLNNLENHWSLKKHDRMQNYPRYKLSKDTVFQPWTGNTRLYMEATFQNPKEVLEQQLQLGNYSKNPNYNYHPAVGLNKSQAELFCLWRSDLANAVYAMRSRSKSKREKYPYKVTYRLPTEAEMLSAERELKSRDRLRYYQDDIFSTRSSDLTFRELQENGNLIIMELNEIGAANTYRPLFNTPVEYYDNQSLKTAFRCVCEVQESL